MYIFWFLHQTTTYLRFLSFHYGCISFDSYIKPQPRLLVLVIVERCISFDSYIKPQLLLLLRLWRRRCISFDSYIKPQPKTVTAQDGGVVYLLIPTSNHNVGAQLNKYSLLYIFWFLHQTTTMYVVPLPVYTLYIFWFLHQTTTVTALKTIAETLYIFWFLHQTTTYVIMILQNIMLYIFWFLHQTTTLHNLVLLSQRCISFDSYIKPQL